MEDLGSTPELGRCPGEGTGNTLKYSCWEIPQTEEPGGLEPTGSQKVRHDWGTNTHKSFLSSSPTCGAVASSSLIFILLLSLRYCSINNLTAHNQLISELRRENPCLCHWFSTLSYRIIPRLIVQTAQPQLNHVLYQHSPSSAGSSSNDWMNKSMILAYLKPYVT